MCKCPSMVGLSRSLPRVWTGFRPDTRTFVYFSLARFWSPSPRPKTERLLQWPTSFMYICTTVGFRGGDFGLSDSWICVHIAHANVNLAVYCVHAHCEAAVTTAAYTKAALLCWGGRPALPWPWQSQHSSQSSMEVCTIKLSIQLLDLIVHNTSWVRGYTRVHESVCSLVWDCVI